MHVISLFINWAKEPYFSLSQVLCTVWRLGVGVLGSFSTHGFTDCALWLMFLYVRPCTGFLLGCAYVSWHQSQIISILVPSPDRNTVKVIYVCVCWVIIKCPATLINHSHHTNNPTAILSSLPHSPLFFTSKTVSKLQRSSYTVWSISVS